MSPENTPKHLSEVKLTFCHIVLYGCLLLSGISYKAGAQHIPVVNPSFNGSPAENRAPEGWHRIHTTDIQPGIYNITQTPSDGGSYVGMHSGHNYVEGISQQLTGTMKAGYYYSTHFDLAFSPVYAYDGCYGNLAIYGGDKPGQLKELLWTSGEFDHTGWRRYSALFSPAADYTCITLAAYYSRKCDKSLFGVVVLLDNLSPWLYEQLKLECSTTTTCVGNNTGSAAVKVQGGSLPYTYLWSPGGSTADRLSGLAAGAYQVTVTDSKGVVSQATATVQVTDLATQATVTPSECYGDGRGQISLHTTGGLPPYRYYFNGSHNGAYTPVFERLTPGTYEVMVKDEQGCSNELKELLVEGPPPLRILGATVKPCSCSEAKNGQIIPQVRGGVPPYEYRVNNGGWQSDSVLAKLPAGNHHYEIRDKNGCSITGSGEITSPYKNCLLVLPNAFSPNGDGNNDVFRPKVYDDIHSYQLTIYNRWGALIFRSNDPGTGWNGTYKGRLMLAQHYTYVCTFYDRNNTPQELKGAVMLVR